MKCDIPVKDVTKINWVIGIGTTLHCFVDINGEELFIPCISYHLKQTDVRLFSPQTYHQLHGGHSVVVGNQVTMRMTNHSRINIHIETCGTNLPVIHNSFVTEHQKRHIGPQMPSLLAHSRLGQLDLFGDVDSIRSFQALTTDKDKMNWKQLFDEHYSCFCGSCVRSPANQNLLMGQKELFLWHWKLGVSMHQIQGFMKPRTFEEPNGNRKILPAIIKSKFEAASKCAVPACESCMLARARKRLTNTNKVTPLADKEGALLQDKLEVGDFVSTDQFICKTPGRLLTGYGRESRDC